MARNVQFVKDQLTRLASADFKFGIGGSESGALGHDQGHVIDGFELWTPRNENHTRPLASAMGLDVYTWLAQRLTHPVTCPLGPGEGPVPEPPLGRWGLWITLSEVQSFDHQ